MGMKNEKSMELFYNEDKIHYQVDGEDLKELKVRSNVAKFGCDKIEERKTLGSDCIAMIGYALEVDKVLGFYPNTVFGRNLLN